MGGQFASCSWMRRPTGRRSGWDDCLHRPSCCWTSVWSSGLHAETVRGVFCVFFFSSSSFAPLLRPWKAVQLPRHSVSAAVSRGPRLKTPKGPPGKVARPYLSGLMSKMLQSAGNLLQSGTRSLLLQRAAQKKKKKRKGGGREAEGEKREREMKGRKNDI